MLLTWQKWIPLTLLPILSKGDDQHIKPMTLGTTRRIPPATPDFAGRPTYRIMRELLTSADVPDYCNTMNQHFPEDYCVAFIKHVSRRHLKLGKHYLSLFRKIITWCSLWQSKVHSHKTICSQEYSESVILWKKII